MKKCIISMALTMFVVGFVFCNEAFSFPNVNTQKEIYQCIKKLNQLTNTNVAACYHKYMPNSTLEGSTVKDQYGYSWDFTVKGKCTPDDDCRAHVSKDKAGFDVLLWYEMPKGRK